MNDFFIFYFNKHSGAKKLDVVAQVKSITSVV